MQSVGEVMAIGRTFRESLQKAFRSLEVGLVGFKSKKTEYRNLDLSKIRFATAFRLIKIKEALEQGYSIDEIYEQTKIDHWFLFQINKIIEIEKKSLKECTESLFELKRNGFSDKYISDIWNTTEDYIRNLRKNNNIIPTYKVVDTCSAEFSTITPYLYSSYENPFITEQTFDEVNTSNKKKVIILGGGPNRIGQGIEFE